jgi:chromosomal replication initiation ATPase DnaA
LRRRRRTEGQRKIAVYLSKILSGEKNAAIGSVFGITLQAVTNAVRSVEKRMEEDIKFSSGVTKVNGLVANARRSV